MSLCEKRIDHLQACKYFTYNASWENALFPSRHVSSPLYYCNTSELMWCGHYLCGLWWAVHLLITGLTLCRISATYKETKTVNAGYVLLDVSSMKLWTQFLLQSFYRLMLSGHMLLCQPQAFWEKALNVTVVILYLILTLTDFLCPDPNFRMASL